MHAKDSVFQGPNETEISFTDQPITGWGGLALIARFFEAIGIRKVLEQALPDGRTSPNKVPVVDMAMELLATILMGGRRFAHVERFRTDPVARDVRARTESVSDDDHALLRRLWAWPCATPGGGHRTATG